MIHPSIDKFLEAVDYGPNKVFTAHISHCVKCADTWAKMQEKLKPYKTLYKFNQKEIDLYGDSHGE